MKNKIGETKEIHSKKYIYAGIIWSMETKSARVRSFTFQRFASYTKKDLIQRPNYRKMPYMVEIDAYMYIKVYIHDDSHVLYIQTYMYV